MAGPGEAEISFEEAMGQAPGPNPSPGAKTTAASGEIDFAEAAAIEPAKPAQPFDRGLYNQEFEKALSTFVPDPEKDYQPSPNDSFTTRVGKTLMRGVGAFARNPYETALGAGKALTSGAIGLAETGAAGLKRIAKTGAFVAENKQLALMGQLGFSELV